MAALAEKLRPLGLDLGDLRGELLRDVTALGKRLRSAHQKSGETLLLVVDQFEELITLCLDSDERQLYADALVQAAGAPRQLDHHRVGVRPE